MLPQTNVQLYKDLLKKGYSENDVRGVRHGYELAIELYAGRFRGSGKPFVNHLVGTAGVLCWLKAPGHVVAAGLLHALYSQGEFSNRSRPDWELIREKVKQTVGDQSEGLILRYAEMPWNPTKIRVLIETAPSLSREENEVVLIRLANELDDHYDAGILYCKNAVERRQLIGHYLMDCADLADRIGQPKLGKALRSTFEEVVAAEVPDYLQTQHDVSFEISVPVDKSRILIFLLMLKTRPRLAFTMAGRKMIKVFSASFRKARNKLKSKYP